MCIKGSRSLLNERFHGAGEVTPLSPHSAPVQMPLQSPPARRKFLAEEAGSGFQSLVVSTNGARGNCYFSVRVVGADS